MRAGLADCALGGAGGGDDRPAGRGRTGQRPMPRWRWAVATCAAGLATTGEAALALLHTQLAVGIVRGLRVARGVERGSVGRAEMQVSGAKVGLELPGRAGAEDRRGHRWPIAHPRQRDLGHGHATLVGDLLYRVDDVPGAPRAPPVVSLHAAIRVLAQ